MKFSKIALLLAAMVMVLSLVVAGCGGGGPVDGAKDFFNNMFSEKGGEYLCKAAGSDAAIGMAMLGAMGAKIDTGGMKFELVKEEGDKATVKISGKIKISMLGQTEEEEIPAEEILMIKEDGKWKMCDPSFIESIM